MSPITIAIADGDHQSRQSHGDALAGLGHEVICRAPSGRELIDFCRGTAPDLLVVDFQLSDMDGLQALKEVHGNGPRPVVLTAAQLTPDLPDTAAAHCVFSCLTKPVKLADMQAAITLSLKRFQQVEQLRQALRDIQQQLDNRKKIERAKGVLMRRNKMDEDVAFRHLVRVARIENIKVADLAEMILLSDAAFTEPARSSGLSRH